MMPKASKNVEVSVHGHEMPRANLFKLVGLIAFIAITIAVCIALWPSLVQLSTEGGAERLIHQIRDAGPWGMLVVLGMEFLQVVVAFIPGEVVQMAAGALYGSWLGAFIIIIGAVLSSWFIYEMVHRLGQPFVSAMVPTKHLEKIREFERSGKLKAVVFILFLLPGLPKDTFTYLVPLTEMNVRSFLVITTVGRIPGLLLSTYAANGLVDGNMTQSFIILVIIAIMAGLAIFFREKLIRVLNRI